MTDTPERFDLILKGGTVVNQNGTNQLDVAISKGKIAGLGNFSADMADEVQDVSGLHVLPGVIDSQVHFREPGNEHKEDLESGSRAAVMGGVTAVFEMPNTSPGTTTAEALADKVKRGRNRMFCDFAFYVGATKENSGELGRLERLEGACGIKVFMGSSTGNLLVDDDQSVAKVLANISRRAAFHSEDEERLIERENQRVTGDPSSHPVWRDERTALLCTKRLLKLARAAGKQIHVLHITTAEEIALLADYKDIASCEITPQHLTLAAEDAYARLGTYAQMNPPIRAKRHRAKLWWGIQQGIADVLGSDHAPHTREEKAMAYPASPAGMPGVQTLVPLMLSAVNEGKMSLERFVDLTSAGPQRLFNILGKGRLAKGYDADLTIVDMKAKRTITADWLQSRCGWSPFEGNTVQGWAIGTLVRGQRVMWEDKIVAKAKGQPIRFEGCG